MMIDILGYELYSLVRLDSNGLIDYIYNFVLNDTYNRFY